MKILLGILVLFGTFLGVYSASAAYYQQLVPLPSGLTNQNGKTYLKASTMKTLFGNPCALRENCQSVTNPTLSPMIETRNVGPFRVTGMKQAIDALARALQKVHDEKPDLYAVLGSSGMLCCRAIRGSTTTFSNHAWGAAIDINIGGKLDPRGDAKAQRGLLALYPYMAAEGFYWAAGYSGSSEDAMHFEIADEVMKNWNQGDWGTCKTTGGISGECKDISQCTGSTQSNRCPGPSNIRCCYNQPPPQYRCVSATALNIRSGACTSYSILTTANKGDALKLLSTPSKTTCGFTWINVQYKGFTGWVANSYVYTCTPLNPSSVNITIPNETINGTYLEAEDADSAYQPSGTPELFTFAVQLFVCFSCLLLAYL